MRQEVLDSSTVNASLTKLRQMKWFRLQFNCTKCFPKKPIPEITRLDTFVVYFAICVAAPATTRGRYLRVNVNGNKMAT